MRPGAWYLYKNPGPARARDSGWGGESMGGPAQITLRGWARPVAFLQLRQLVWDYVGLLY